MASKSLQPPIQTSGMEGGVINIELRSRERTIDNDERTIDNDERTIDYDERTIDNDQQTIDNDERKLKADSAAVEERGQSWQQALRENPKALMWCKLPWLPLLIPAADFTYKVYMFSLRQPCGDTMGLLEL